LLDFERRLGYTENLYTNLVNAFNHGCDGNYVLGPDSIIPKLWLPLGSTELIEILNTVKKLTPRVDRKIISERKLRRDMRKMAKKTLVTIASGADQLEPVAKWFIRYGYIER
jgi:hypothetical protein